MEVSHPRKILLGAEVDRLVRDLESEVCPFYLDLQPEIPNLQVRCAWAAQGHVAVCAVCFLRSGPIVSLCKGTAAPCGSKSATCDNQASSANSRNVVAVPGARGPDEAAGQQPHLHNDEDRQHAHPDGGAAAADGR